MTRSEKAASAYVDDRVGKVLSIRNGLQDAFCAGVQWAKGEAIRMIWLRIDLYGELIGEAINDAIRYRLSNEDEALRNLRSALETLGDEECK